MNSLDEERVKCELRNRIFWFLAWQESRECCIFISDVGFRGIYLSDWINHVLSRNFKDTVSAIL